MRILAGKHKGRLIAVPKEGVRPTSGKLRETLFNICQQEIEGADFLDLFAGAGAIGLEALSRGAASVTFVEKERAVAKIIQKNLETFGEEATVMTQDVLTILPKLRGQFDIIFADPPYEQGLSAKVLKLLDKTPLLAPEGRLFVEDRTFDEVALTTLTLHRERRQGNTCLREYRRL